jgi:hypothetical protein
VYVAVIAEVPLGDGSRTSCEQDFLFHIQPDAALVRNATRIVVPVAGSVRGAFNSVFKTRLLLENRWTSGPSPAASSFIAATPPATPRILRSHAASIHTRSLRTTMSSPGCTSRA